MIRDLVRGVVDQGDFTGWVCNHAQRDDSDSQSDRAAEPS